MHSVQFSCSVMSDSLRPREPQHARPPGPSPTPKVHPDQCPSSWWCHPTISSSVIPFSSCPQSFPASGSFPTSQLFTSGGQSFGVSASTSVLPLKTQDWSPLGGLRVVYMKRTLRKCRQWLLGYIPELDTLMCTCMFEVEVKCVIFYSFLLEPTFVLNFPDCVEWESICCTLVKWLGRNVSRCWFQGWWKLSFHHREWATHFLPTWHVF